MWPVLGEHSQGSHRETEKKWQVWRSPLTLLETKSRRGISSTETLAIEMFPQMLWKPLKTSPKSLKKRTMWTHHLYSTTGNIFWHFALYECVFVYLYLHILQKIAHFFFFLIVLLKRTCQLSYRMSHSLDSPAWCLVGAFTLFFSPRYFLQLGGRSRAMTRSRWHIFSMNTGWMTLWTSHCISLNVITRVEC